MAHPIPLQGFCAPPASHHQGMLIAALCSHCHKGSDFTFPLLGGVLAPGLDRVASRAKEVSLWHWVVPSCGCSVVEDKECGD